jgi:alkylation response protein AidB-like acyl-CoA dehydrogenase
LLYTIIALIGLTDDQAEFYKLAKSFSDRELKPFADEWDSKSHFPLDTYKKFADLGFAGIFVKDDVGGSGLSRQYKPALNLNFICIIIRYVGLIPQSSLRHLQEAVLAQLRCLLSIICALE